MLIRGEIKKSTCILFFQIDVKNDRATSNSIILLCVIREIDK